MSSLRSVVYVSSATRRLCAAQLEELLDTSRTANRANGVTGVLIYAEGSFMQCVEGPDDCVADTYGRIRASRRHHQIVELINGPIAVRSFEGWEMALAQRTPSALLALSTARWRARADEPEGVSPGWEGRGLMKALWRTTQR